MPEIEPSAGLIKLPSGQIVEGTFNYKKTGKYTSCTALDG